MKKSLFILTLAFASYGASALNTADHSTLKAKIINQCSNKLPGFLQMDLGDNYVITGELIRVGLTDYVYAGVLSQNGSTMGSVTIAFSVTDDLIPAIIEDTINETYGDSDTEAAVKTRHDTLLHCVRNMR